MFTLTRVIEKISPNATTKEESYKSQECFNLYILKGLNHLFI